MKILFACPSGPNPFLANLIKGIRSCSQEIDIHLSDRVFWKLDGKYDIVHLHWIESLSGWDLNARKAAEIASRLNSFKARGASACMTRHNKKPHRQQGTGDYYHPVLEKLEGVVHMGQYSVEDFHQQYGAEPWYSTISHAVIEHPAYETTDNYLSKVDCRDILGINADQKVVLVFGAVRSKAEADFCSEVMGLLKTKNVLFLCPRWRTDISGLGARVRRKWVGKPKYVPCQIGSQFVKEEEVQLYLNTADVVLLPRMSSSNLNSGVVPLAYTFGRVVVGPGISVIGELLRKNGNPVFEPEEPRQAAGELDKILNSDPVGIESKNLNYANNEMSLSCVGQKYVEFYKQLLAR